MLPSGLRWPLRTFTDDNRFGGADLDTLTHNVTAQLDQTRYNYLFSALPALFKRQAVLPQHPRKQVCAGNG
jgi:hypothetical protein